MSFEALVDELRDENLLENTILEAEEKRAADTKSLLETAAASQAKDDPAAEPQAREYGPQIYSQVDAEMKLGNGETVEIRKAGSESEFFKKRAMEEVSSLQMVEHILTGVERQYAKRQPEAFDDFNVKIALNNFLQVAENVKGSEHKTAEFALMQETEAWVSSLARRDEKLLVPHLRRFCENTRPMLSSRALIAMAKFYRNLPYTPDIRAKFEYVVTRLFTRPGADHSRSLLFPTHEMIAHTQSLYADWSSLSLFNSEEDADNADLARASLKQFADEANGAAKFDDLTASDFYNRLRVFKEGLAEMFFEPGVLAAAIECNVEVGNVYLRLLAAERTRFENEYLQQDEDAVIDTHGPSLAAARSLELSDVFGRDESADNDEDAQEAAFQPADEAARVEITKPAPEKRLAPAAAAPSRIDLAARGFAGVNRWLLVASTVMIMLSVALWVWSTYFVESAPSSVGVRTFDAANSPMKNELKIGRVSGDTFYGVMQPTWETLPEESKKEVLTKIYLEGKNNGWKQVSLMDSRGNTVGFASATRLEVK